MIINQKSGSVQAELEYHNPQNYLKVILSNYYLFYSEARIGMVKLLRSEYDRLTSEHPKNIYAQKIVFLEIYSKLIQVAEDYSLLSRILMEPKRVVDIYMNSDNGDIRKFYRLARRGLSKNQIMKIQGLDKLGSYASSITRLSEKEELNKLIASTVSGVSDNTKMLANIFLDELDKKSGPIDVYDSIKHGLKLVLPTPLSKRLWPFMDEESVNIMHRVRTDNAGHEFIVLGGIECISKELLDSMQHNIEFFSSEISQICQMRLLVDADFRFFIRTIRLYVTAYNIEHGFEPGKRMACPCGSSKNYKQCCLEFRSIYESTNFGKLLGLS